MPLTVASRRDPFPYDARIDELGVLLKADKDGQMVSRRVQPLNATPTSFEYGSNSPFVEATYEFRHLALGGGERFQPSGTPRRYKKTIKVDASINGRWMKGPHFHAETVIAGQPIRYMIRGPYSGTDSLFALAGRYVYVRVSDGTWSLVAGSDCGASSYWTQAALFTFAGSTTKTLYFAQSNGNLAKFDGTTFTILTGAQGPSSHRASSVEVSDKELWVGYDNFVEKVEADPVTTSNYSAAIRVGDGTYPITWLRANKNILYIFKTNGWYTFDETGVARERSQGLRHQINDINGRNAAVWMDDLYCPFKESFFKVSPDGAMKPVGMEQMLDNEEDVRGYIVGFAGHNTWFGYEIVYNEHEAKTFLGKYGTWIEQEDNRSNDILEFVDVHHLAIADWTKRAIFIEIFNMPGTNDRLYIGFDDGTVEWMWLPKHSPNPANDPLCEFTTVDGYMYGPDFHSGFAADRKIFRGFAIFGPYLDNNNYVTVEWRLSPEADWTPLASAQRFTVSGQRIDFESGSSVIGRTLQYRFVLVNSTTTLSPQIDGAAVHSIVRPAFILEHMLIVQARNQLPKYDGTVEYRTADQIRNAIMNACSRSGTVIMKLPHEEAEELIIQDYNASLVGKLQRYGAAEWEITIRGIQFKSLTTAESAQTLNELTYGQLEQYTYGQLENLL